MNTMFKHRILAGALFFMSLIGFSSCDDKIDGLQVTEEAPFADKTLYEVIANDSELSDFLEVIKSCSIENRDFADSLLNKARVYTVWAPLNKSFDKQYWLDKIANGEREDVVKTFVFAHIANHLHPANGELKKGNQVIMLNTKMSQFEGDYKTAEYSFGGCRLVDLNERVWNGMLHKISGMSEYEYNIWEYLKMGSAYINGYEIDSVANYLYSFDVVEFSPGSSILGPIKDGAQTYLDSVFVKSNRMLNVYNGVGPLDAEDSLYTVYIPTNDVWKAALVDAKRFYHYDYKQNLPAAMDSVYIDSLMNYYPYFNIIKYISYSDNEQRYVSSPDSIIPAYRGGKRPLFAKSQLDNGNVVFSKTLSNGTFKVVNKLPYSSAELWYDTIRIEGEDTEMRTAVSNCIEYPRYAPLNQINPIFGGNAKISGNRYFEGFSEKDKASATFCLPNVLSAKYKVAIIVVPKHITNTKVDDDELLPSRYNITISQSEAGILYDSKRKIKSDPTRLDTIFLTVDDTDEIATIEFPYCEYYNTYSSKDFSAKLTLETDGGARPQNYDMSLRIDAILLIPVLDTEE